MAGARFQKKRSANKGVRKSLKVASPGLARAVKAIAKKEASKLIETKYVTGVVNNKLGDFVNADVASGFISKVLIGNLGNLQPAIPRLTAGTGSDSVIGSSIHQARGKVDFAFSLQEGTTGATSKNIIIKLFCLESRSTRSIYNLQTYMPTNDLLRVGLDETTDWQPANPGFTPTQLNMMPVNALAWKVHHVKTFHLMKNAGLQQGDAGGNGPNLACGALRTFSWSWKHDGSLKYNENGGAGVAGTTDYPTNYAPVYGIAAYYADGQPMTTEALTGQVNVNVRTHMWYKDA